MNHEKTPGEHIPHEATLVSKINIFELIPNILCTKRLMYTVYYIPYIVYQAVVIN